jgi:hypothetical protein
VVNGGGKSDGSVVPKKLANKGRGAPRPAERVEGRVPTKGNSGQDDRSRVQNRADLNNRLARVRQAARKDKEEKFTSIFHHVYDVNRLDVLGGLSEPGSRSRRKGWRVHARRQCSALLTSGDGGRPTGRRGIGREADW